jgi:diguanylate cyclase (GGDEF)-like protein/PAS domain S-box-containing protein
VISVVEDISERKRAEDALRTSEETLRATFSQAGVGIIITSPDRRYLQVNDKYCDMVGYAREELLGMSHTEVLSPGDVSAVIENRRKLIFGEAHSVTHERQLMRKDGSLIWVNHATSLARGQDGKPRHFITVTEDISERKRAEERLTHLAHYDVLTGLPNRTLFYDRLKHALAQARRNQWTVGVMFIDVDRFKNINDTFGHAVGDSLLRQVSQRLSGSVRAGDTVGRLGGDEFGVVLSTLTCAQDAALLAQKIIASFSDPFALNQTDVYVTASIGITVYPDDSTDQDALIKNADIAMYRAKDEGRNTYEFYAPGMHDRAVERLDKEVLLRRAIERQEFVLHYQPKVALDGERVIGAAALLRWSSKELGLVEPLEFIPIAEESGLIVPIGEWVLKTACAQNKAWQDQGLPPLMMSVSLSARQFQQKNLVETMAALLRDTGLDPRFLELDITESMIMPHAERSCAILQRLNELGVQLTVDNFGTGYSSLAYLKRFPVQRLKIDPSFVRDITTDSDDAAIVTAVIAMAKSLKLKVVADGVENDAQLAFLAGLGCDEYQGSRFSEPMPPEEFGRLSQLSWRR